MMGYWYDNLLIVFENLKHKPASMFKKLWSPIAVVARNALYLIRSVFIFEMIYCRLDGKD